MAFYHQINWLHKKTYYLQKFENLKFCLLHLNLHKNFFLPIHGIISCYSHIQLITIKPFDCRNICIKFYPWWLGMTLTLIRRPWPLSVPASRTRTTPALASWPHSASPGTVSSHPSSRSTNQHQTTTVNYIPKLINIKQQLNYQSTVETKLKECEITSNQYINQFID